MNEQSANLIQSIRGPLMLITIGVLFAFDRFTEFRFSQTWPVILIMAGLLRLLGGPRRRYRGDYYPANNPVPQGPPLHDHPAPAVRPDVPSPRYSDSHYGEPQPPSSDRDREARP